MTATDETLNLYADNKLSPEERERLIDEAKHDTELAEALTLLEESQSTVKAAFNMYPAPAMPEGLRDSLNQTISAHQNNAEDNARPRATVTNLRSDRKDRSYGVAQAIGMAACLMLCVGAGFLIGAGKGQQTDSPAVASNAQTENLNKQQQWVQRVADYQTLYTAATVSQLRADLPATREKLEQLAEKTGIKTAIPDLSEQGYQFARAQELGFEGKTLIQLVYAKPGEMPLALCFMQADGEADNELLVGSRFGLGTASWIAENQRYVIVANEAATDLEHLHAITAKSFAGS